MLGPTSATNFIWRVWHRAHHRDSILPPPHDPHMSGRSTRLTVRLFTSPIWRVEHRRPEQGAPFQVMFDLCLVCSVNERCLIVFSNRKKLYFFIPFSIHMNVRSAGLKFKIATSFIWRVGHGGHHRDSTLPPYGWSSHEVNSERRFFSAIRRVKHRGLIRREKNHLLFFLERARADLSPVYSVKVRHLEQARSNLCHLGSACSFHLAHPTHLVDKRGAHE